MKYLQEKTMLYPEVYPDSHDRYTYDMKSLIYNNKVSTLWANKQNLDLNLELNWFLALIMHIGYICKTGDVENLHIFSPHLLPQADGGSF